MNDKEKKVNDNDNNEDNVKVNDNNEKKAKISIYLLYYIMNTLNIIDILLI